MAPLNVLVIEDDEGLRLALEVYLAGEERVASVESAGDGDEGLALARELHPDVIITDSSMPGLAGDRLGLALRNECPDATIISFSGRTQSAKWADARIVKGERDSFDDLVGAVSGVQRPQTPRPEAGDSKSYVQRRRVHELRNALAPVMGYASLLANAADSLGPAEIRKIGDRIARASERASRVIDEL